MEVYIKLNTPEACSLAPVGSRNHANLRDWAHVQILCLYSFTFYINPIINRVVDFDKPQTMSYRSSNSLDMCKYIHYLGEYLQTLARAERVMIYTIRLVDY